MPTSSGEPQLSTDLIFPDYQFKFWEQVYYYEPYRGKLQMVGRGQELRVTLCKCHWYWIHETQRSREAQFKVQNTDRPNLTLCQLRRGDWGEESSPHSFPWWAATPTFLDTEQPGSWQTNQNWRSWRQEDDMPPMVNNTPRHKRIQWSHQCHQQRNSWWRRQVGI